MFSRRYLRPFAMLILAAVVVLSGSAVASACPTCKNAIAEGDPQHQNMVAGYFYSILFMMSMPFVILGSFGSYMYLEVRRARAAREKMSQPDAREQPPASE